MALIEFKNFSFSYLNSDGNVSDIKSLDNINLEVEYGDFVLLCGPSGCGKTTLLTNLKKELIPSGKKTGKIKFKGIEIDDLDEISSACDIAYLFQNPDSQIVTDTVIQEIAFPLENIGLPTEEIRNRIAEIVSFFGINNLLHKNVNELSGGQKQLVNLCSLLALKPEVLLLDEPMSQLDPISSYEFLSIVKRLNEEFSITVILSEHKSDSIFPLIDKAVFLKDGKIEYVDNPHNICKEVMDDEIFENYLPVVTKIYNSLSTRYTNLIKLNTPLSIREGRRCLDMIREDLIKISDNDNNSNNLSLSPTYHTNQKDNLPQAKNHIIDKIHSKNKNPLIKMEGIYFAYDKNNLILKNVDFNLNKGEFVCLIGGNGVGKSTFLQVLTGIIKPIKGKVKYAKGINLTYVHQNPMIHFSKESVKEEFLLSLIESDLINSKTYQNLSKLSYHEFIDSEIFNNLEIDKVKLKFKDLAELFDVSKLLDKHPYDCSGGEQQKIVIVKALLQNSDILVLDEPTKGLDPISNKFLADILNLLIDNGLTIVMTSHDLDFVACNCKRCVMLFDKGIQIDNDPKVIFAENNFYTTFVNRMVKNYIPEIVTLDDMKSRWKLED